MHTLGALMITASLAGCASWVSGITPYRIDILQGNFVSKEQAAALKLGMTQDAVRNILGTPLLTDPFHASRWDYVFSIRPGNRPVEQKRLTVYFDKDSKLAKIEGDALPSEEEFVARIDDLRRGVARAGDEPKAEVQVLAAAAAAPVAPVAPVAPAVATTPATVAAAPAADTQPVPAPAVEPSKPIQPIAAAQAPTTVTPAPAPAATTAAPVAPTAKEMVASELAAIEREVVAMLEAWRNAWASKKVNEYLSFYTPEYKGEYTNRSTWEKQRRTRLTAPKSIRLDLTDARILITAPDKARVSMQQNYQTESMKETGAKSLYLVKRNGKWLIENELFFSKPVTE